MVEAAPDPPTGRPTAAELSPPGAEEETFLTLLRAARARIAAGGALEEVLPALEAASTADPSRAEALFEAARLCRVRGLHEPAWRLADRGLALPMPEGEPAQERWIYEYGLQQEFSIAANFAKDPAVKDRGYAACDWLALNREVPQGVRDLAHSNLQAYLLSAAALAPSFSTRRILFQAPPGCHATNPSIARVGDQLVLVLRTVNYEINHGVPDGDPARYLTEQGEPLRTRNFLLQVSPDLSVSSSEEILAPVDMPAPLWGLKQGFMDLRPVVWGGDLWSVACVRELNAEGWCEMVLARIEGAVEGQRRLADWRSLHPEGPRSHEKNWMPLVGGESLRLLYRCDPTRIIDDRARTLSESTPELQADQFRGGSQLVPFDGGWLGIVHEVKIRLSDSQRFYRHRLIWLDAGFHLLRVSRPFYFHHGVIEFAAGLAWHPDERRIVITYGIDDKEAWIATVESREVREALMSIHQLKELIKPTAQTAGA